MMDVLVTMGRLGLWIKDPELAVWFDMLRLRRTKALLGTTSTLEIVEASTERKVKAPVESQRQLINSWLFN